MAGAFVMPEKGQHMPAMDGSASFRGDLSTRVIRAGKPAPVRSLRLPGQLGRVMFSRDPGDARIFANQVFATDLTAIHRRADGEIVEVRRLGSGLVTNVGVMALANDFAWAQNCQTLKLANNHATGTGATAAATTDIALQTPAAPTTTTAVAGVQTLVSAANSQTYKTVATINYTSNLAITEWALLTALALSVTTGTPFTATSATSGTATGTPYTASSASVQGEQQLIVVPGTTTVYGLITSNSTSALTVPAWYKVADGTAGSTPGSTEAFSIKPVMWDRRVFAAINVANGDSIQFVYQLAVNSGG